MVDKYEYHKQNDYPGERIAERERVAATAKDAKKKADTRVAEKGRTEELKADARVAERSEMDDELMSDEKKRSTNRARRINKQRNTTDMVGVIVIAGLILILIAGSVFGFRALQKQSDKVDNLNWQLDKANGDNCPTNNGNDQTPVVTGTDTNSPTIVYMSPANNEQDVDVNAPITVQFNEDIDPLSINKNTFIVEQRTTPKSGSNLDQYRSLQIEGVISYNDRKATFMSNDGFWPSQIYGNVFTVTLTQGVKDKAGNLLEKDYIWSFTTGNSNYNTGATTTQTN